MVDFVHSVRQLSSETNNFIAEKAAPLVSLILYTCILFFMTLISLPSNCLSVHDRQKLGWFISFILLEKFDNVWKGNISGQNLVTCSFGTNFKGKHFMLKDFIPFQIFLKIFGRVIYQVMWVCSMKEWLLFLVSYLSNLPWINLRQNLVCSITFVPFEKFC